MPSRGAHCISQHSEARMHTQTAPVYLYNSPVKADQAIQALGRSGFDLTQLSLIGKICPNGDHALGAHSSVACIPACDGPTAIGHNVWQLLAAPDVFFMPTLGTLAMTGPVVQTVVSTLEEAVTADEPSALGATFSQLGASKTSATRYETALKADNYVLMVHGTDADVSKAHEALFKANIWKQAA